MRDWVKPFLLKEIEKTFKKHKQLREDPDREKLIEMQQKALETQENIYYKLTDYINTDFGLGLSPDIDWMINAFGSVLADLPKTVFKNLSAMKNLYLTFTPHPGAAVKQFRLEYNLKAEQLFQIVTFPFESTFMPPNAARGEIVHELAHVYAGHIGGTEEMEDEADKIARKWGFEKEIEALRDYEKEHWKPKLVSNDKS